MSAATRNEYPVLDSSSATYMDLICDAHRLPVTVGYSTRSLLSSRNTPRISCVAASASRSFLTRWRSCRSISLSCALSRWPSARSGRGLEAFLQLCALRRTRPTLQASPVTLQRAQGFATKRERASRILNKISGTVTIERVSRSIRHETITSVRLELMIEQPTNSDGRGSRLRASVHQSRCGNDPA